MLVRALALATLLAALASPAAADSLPGLMTEEQAERARAEAAEQKRDAQAMVRRNAFARGYTEAQVEAALRPAMELKGTFEYEVEPGTVIEFPWFRTGFAENELANTGKRILRDALRRAVRRETNKGGNRIDAGVTADEVYALALKMDVKLAMAGDAIGGHAVRGAKGGVGIGVVKRASGRYAGSEGQLVDPQAYDADRIIDAFGRAYLAAGGKVGVGYDIHAGDVFVKKPQLKHLAEVVFGTASRPSIGVSGKDEMVVDGVVKPGGGIQYRADSTGDGVWISARLAARRVRLRIDRATVMAQGWGEVGRAFGVAAARDGARLIGVQERFRRDGELVQAVVENPHGQTSTPEQTRQFIADIDALYAWTQDGHELADFEGYARLRPYITFGKDASEVKADIVGVNARGGTINEDTVPEYLRSGTHARRRKILVEGANLAETAAAVDLLEQPGYRAGLLVVTGDLANLAGVHVSNLEAVQNLIRRVVTSATARDSVKATIEAGWHRAMKLARRYRLSERASIELGSVDAMMKRSLHLRGAPMRHLERPLLRPTTGPRWAHGLRPSRSPSGARPTAHPSGRQPAQKHARAHRRESPRRASVR